MTSVRVMLCGPLPAKIYTGEALERRAGLLGKEISLMLKNKIKRLMPTIMSESERAAPWPTAGGPNLLRHNQMVATALPLLADTEIA